MIQFSFGQEPQRPFARTGFALWQPGFRPFFLFTAGRNGSNRPTPTGLALAALATLWIAGRVLSSAGFGRYAVHYRPC